MKTLIESFKTEIGDRVNEVDPAREQDWYSLALGWGIAKGLTPDAAHDFARYIRYNTKLG
jgi:hypothetical protein